MTLKTDSPFEADPPVSRLKDLTTRVLETHEHALAGQLLNQQHYPGYRPVMAEAFTDIEQFESTGYKATNWQPLGLTKGFERHRADYFHKLGRPKKFGPRSTPSKQSGLQNVNLNSKAHAVDPKQAAPSSVSRSQKPTKATTQAVADLPSQQRAHHFRPRPTPSSPPPIKTCQQATSRNQPTMQNRLIAARRASTLIGFIKTSCMPASSEFSTSLLTAFAVSARIGG